MREALILMSEGMRQRSDPAAESGRVHGSVLFATDRVTKLLLELQEEGGSVGVAIAAAGPTVAALAAAATLARSSFGSCDDLPECAFAAAAAQAGAPRRCGPITEHADPLE